MVCRSPSGCWHEHRHCQYRYGLGSQYGEYLGFWVLLALGGGGRRFPRPCQGGAVPAGVRGPGAASCPGQVPGRGTAAARGAAGVGAAFPLRRRRIPGRGPGGTDRGARGRSCGSSGGAPALSAFPRATAPPAGRARAPHPPPRAAPAPFASVRAFS